MKKPVAGLSCACVVLAFLSACGGGSADSGGSGSGGAAGNPQLYGIVNTFFSNQLVGTTSAPQNIKLQSSGTSAVVFSGISVSGPFTVGGTCSGSLAPGAECTVTVTFTPTTSGAISGLITLSSNVPGRSYTISIDATGFVASGWVPGQFAPSQNFAARCATPRSGTNPQTGSSYLDLQGGAVDERNWLRSWTNETYLWFDEVPDRDPGVYASNDAYFQILKTAGTKDKFHFTYATSDWVSLSQSGVSAGYGTTFSVLASTPPRRIVVAYTDPGTPAALANISRGAAVLAVDGVDAVVAGDQASVDVLNAGLFPDHVGVSHSITIMDPGASTSRIVTLVSANVTSVPVQNVRTINTATGSVGYMLFNDHLATSESALVSAFSTLKAAGVSDLVLDIRYNGGGYLDIASEIAFMIAGPGPTAGKTFELTQFNSKNPTTDPVTHQSITPLGFHSTTVGFSIPPGQALPSLNLSRVFVLTGPGTCSASESIINSLQGVNVGVIQIGSTTCGKPYGFYPQDNCGTTYFSIQFRGVNAKGFGDYPDGFSPINTTSKIGVTVPGCSVADDFAHQLGDPAEGRLASALNYRTTNTCLTAPTGIVKPQASESGEGYVPPVGDGTVVKSIWQENRTLRDPRVAH